MTVLIIIYWVGVVMQIVIRAPFRRVWKTSAKTSRQVSLTEKTLLGLLTVGMLIIPLIYSVTDWLDFLDYHLPVWAGWLGVFLLVCALLLFARAHMDLKSNWSPSLEILADHSLVSNGIYRYIRHPMYASQWVWTIAQILLLQNWLAGPVGLLVFIPFYMLRVRAEEKMMLAASGDEYQEYMKKTGRIMPKFKN